MQYEGLNQFSWWDIKKPFFWVLPQGLPKPWLWGCLPCYPAWLEHFWTVLNPGEPLLGRFMGWFKVNLQSNLSYREKICKKIEVERGQEVHGLRKPRNGPHHNKIFDYKLLVMIQSIRVVILVANMLVNDKYSKKSEGFDIGWGDIWPRRPGCWFE